MSKVKMFWSASLNDLEDKINKWLEENDENIGIMDLQIRITPAANWYAYIFYVEIGKEKSDG